MENQMKSDDKHRLGVNQIMVLNSFCAMKMKILDMVLESVEKLKLEPIKNKFEEVEKSLRQVLDQMEAQEGETKSEKTLRMRGRSVLFRHTKDSLDATQEELNDLSQWFCTQKFEQRDRQIITKALADLDEIVRSNLFIMGDETARDAYDDFIDPNS